MMTAEPAPEMDTWTHELASGDEVRVAVALDGLVRHLTGLCDALSPAAWEQAILATRSSALFAIVMEEPLTRRCFFQQSDLMGAEDLKAASQTGRLLHATLLARPAWAALRFRQDLGARFLQETLQKRPAPRILTLAAGPLHEADARLAPGLVALDENRAALEEAGQRLPGLTGMNHPAQALLEGLLDTEVFDASYAPGLYNTLPDVLAARLLARQVQLLRLGGRVMISNFARDAVDRGYLEVFLDWKYIYRDEADMERLVAQSRAPCAMKVYREPSGQMVFLELTKTTDSKNLE